MRKDRFDRRNERNLRWHNLDPGKQTSKRRGYPGQLRRRTEISSKRSVVRERRRIATSLHLHRPGGRRLPGASFRGEILCCAKASRLSDSSWCCTGRTTSCAHSVRRSNAWSGLCVASTCHQGMDDLRRNDGCPRRYPPSYERAKASVFVLAHYKACLAVCIVSTQV